MPARIVPHDFLFRRLPSLGARPQQGIMPTVLVVGDEGPVREVTARMLRRAGYDTALAVDGLDAWRQLRREANGQPSRRGQSRLAGTVGLAMTATVA
jgi:hypothetical protein